MPGPEKPEATFVDGGDEKVRIETIRDLEEELAGVPFTGLGNAIFNREGPASDLSVFVESMPAGHTAIHLSIQKHREAGMFHARYVVSAGRIGVLEEVHDPMNRTAVEDEEAMFHVVAEQHHRAQNAHFEIDETGFLERLGSRPVTEKEGRLLLSAIRDGECVLGREINLRPHKDRGNQQFEDLLKALEEPPGQA